MEQAEIILLPGRSCLVAQPLDGEAVDVADIAVGGLVDRRIGRVDDAVAEGDGDRIAVNLLDGLQALLEVARDGLGGGAVLGARCRMAKVVCRRREMTASFPACARRMSASWRMSARKKEGPYVFWICSSKQLSRRISA